MTNLNRILEDLNLKNAREAIPDNLSDKDRRLVENALREVLGDRSTKQLQGNDAHRVIELIDQYEKLEDVSGVRKYFKADGPYSIDKLPKHKAAFDATSDYRETLMLGGNRCGKTTLGGYITAVCATGLYPEGWEGIEYAGPTSNWAVGKTGQTTRDTVQEALMGPIGAWGTGLIPRDCIMRTTARQGIPNALDTVEILHAPTGGISTIGFKSYDQKQAAFFGTAKNVIWLDEPCPDSVYNECLIRTMILKQDPVRGPRGGRIIHTITPKEGLTPLLAQFLASCDLLAGADRIKGLEAMMKMAELEATGV